MSAQLDNSRPSLAEMLDPTFTPRVVVEAAPLHPVAAAESFTDVKLAALTEARAMRADPTYEGVSDYELELVLAKRLRDIRASRPRDPAFEGAWDFGKVAKPATETSPAVMAPGYEPVDVAKEALAHAGRNGATLGKYGRPPKIVGLYDVLNAKLAQMKDADVETVAVAWALFWHANANDRLRANPYVATLATMAHTSSDTVSRRLARLVAAKIIAVDRKASGRAATTYRFLLNVDL